jgi:hypothetical protein
MQKSEYLHHLQDSTKEDDEMRIISDPRFFIFLPENERVKEKEGFGRRRVVLLIVSLDRSGFVLWEVKRSHGTARDNVGEKRISKKNL